MKSISYKLLLFVFLIAIGKNGLAKEKEQVDVLFLYDETASFAIDVHATVEHWVAELNDMYHYSGVKLEVNAIAIEYDEDDRLYPKSILDYMKNGERVNILRNHYGADFVMKITNLTRPTIFSLGFFGNEKDPTLTWKNGQLQKMCSNACQSIQTSRGRAMCYDRHEFCQHVNSPALCTTQCSGLSKSSSRKACYAKKSACAVNGAKIKRLKGVKGFIGAVKLTDSSKNCTVMPFDGNIVINGSDCKNYRVISKSWGGMAYDISTSKEDAYAVIDESMNARTLGHELGHVMGLAHQAPYFGSDGKEFARGHGEDGKFVTIMAYGSYYNKSGEPATVEYFSNPKKGNCLAPHGHDMNNAAPCGVKVGMENEADAVMRLNQKRKDFANFRNTRKPSDKPLLCVEKCEAIKTSRGRAMCYEFEPLCQRLPENILSSDGTFSSGQGNFQTYILSPMDTVDFTKNNVVFDRQSYANESWHVQLFHNVNIESGKQYTVCYDAQAEFVTRSIEVNIDDGAPGYNSIVDAEVSIYVPLTRRQFAHTFTATASNSHARLTINVGGSVRAISFDNIGVYEGEFCGSPL